MAEVVAIHIAPGAGARMKPLDQVQALVGTGLAGDRYATGHGFYSARPTDPGAREVTLIEVETLEWLAAERGIGLAAGEHRRNLTTRGIRLAELLGHRFRVGDVLLEGVKDCPPCVHLEGLVGQAVVEPLLERGGLRARILEGGTLHVGDAIVAAKVEVAAA
jgi:MOSC domain-containing protein YiiM